MTEIINALQLYLHEQGFDIKNTTPCSFGIAHHGKYFTIVVLGEDPTAYIHPGPDHKGHSEPYSITLMDPESLPKIAQALRS